MSATEMSGVENQKRYNSRGSKKLGEVPLKMVGFRLRVKDRELKLLRQMTEDRIQSFAS